jgi:DNA-binding helix-hairpin-helix protein with protein kinase domain
MVSKTGRSMLILGAFAQFAVVAPGMAPAAAQTWQDHRSDRSRSDWNRDRDRDRHDRRRERKDNLAVGIVGTAILAGVIAAAASKKRDRDRDRDENQYRDHAEYCRDRYGNYDPRYDTYRASDGRNYRCE